MPCYNSEPFLQYSVSSVINQTYQNWQLIIINDGSKDNTLEIVNEYASKDSRIKVYSKENGGYATAINYALDVISDFKEDIDNSYFLMLGSDDALSTDLLEKIVNNCQEILPDCIAFKTIDHFPSSPSKVNYATDYKETIFAKDTNIKSFYSSYPAEAEIFFTRDTSKIFKLSLLKDLRYFGKTGIDSDGMFSTLFAHKCSSFSILPIDGYHWSLREDSTSHKVHPLSTMLDKFSSWNKFFNEIIKLEPQMVGFVEKNYVSVVYEDLKKLFSNENYKNQKLDKQSKKTIKEVTTILLKFIKKHKIYKHLKFRLLLLKIFPKLFGLFIK